jgi:hypothetical protein
MKNKRQIGISLNKDEKILLYVKINEKTNATHIESMYTDEELKQIFVLLLDGLSKKQVLDKENRNE